jgi:superfamily I DNA/RNA helicase
MAEPAVAAEICRRFDHVLVDEYQDTNRLRAEILLAPRPDGSGLTVVGDDAQSIYSFRASAVRISSTFRAAFRRRPRSSRSNAIIDQRSRSSMPQFLRWAEIPRDAVAGFRAIQLLPGVGPATARNVIDQLSHEGFAVTALTRFAPPAAAAPWAGVLPHDRVAARCRYPVERVGRARP